MEFAVIHRRGVLKTVMHAEPQILFRMGKTEAQRGKVTGFSSVRSPGTAWRLWAPR